MFTTSLRLSALLLLAWLTPVSHALELQQFMGETQRVTRSSEGISIVWWIPIDYWADTFKQSPNITKAGYDQAISILEPYTMVAIARIKTGAFGAITSTKRSEALEAFELKFNGTVLTPVAEKELSSDMRNLMQITRPMLANALGQLGQGLEFVIFSNRVEGKPLIDAKRGGKLEATFFSDSLKWRLPLGSVLPSKVDGKTGESFPGNYNFNPFTGDHLAVKPAENK